MPINIMDIADDEIVDDEFPQDIALALHSFFSLNNDDRLKVQPKVFKNYKENEDLFTDDENDEWGNYLPRLQESQVWNYCSPEEIYVDRSYENEKIYIVVRFTCEWEVEHGMQFVYREGKTLTRVSPADGNLHD